MHRTDAGGSAHEPIVTASGLHRRFGEGEAAVDALDRPTGGSVVIDGGELSELDDEALTELRRDKLGFVFQFFNLLPVLTAEENILLPLSIAGRKPDPEWLRRLVRTVQLEN